MKRRFPQMLLLAAALVASPGTGRAETMISGRSVQGFAGQLDAMGYKTELLATESKFPVISTTIGQHPTGFAFGGCTAMKNCSYVVLSSSFTDVVDAPSAWLEEINSTYDLVKVTRNDGGQLTIQSGLVLGSDGVPLTTFRMLLDQWQAALAEIAGEAIKAKLVKE